jgi:hypothetical protein
VPQVDYCALATHLIRWDFGELAEVLGVAVPHVNRTKREPVIWPVAIKERFAERYAADLSLWEQRRLPTHTAAKPGVTYPQIRYTDTESPSEFASCSAHGRPARRDVTREWPWRARLNETSTRKWR